MDSTEEPISQSPVCYRHPDRQTRLSCSECGKPICAECSHDSAVGQRCVECARPHGRNRVITARQMSRSGFTASPVTYAFIGLSAALFVLGFFSSDIEATLIEYLALGEFVSTDQGVFVAPVEGVDPWRVLTSAFLHGSPMHILFNMYALYLFGPRLEREAGAAPFIGLYAASAAAGGAAFLALRAGEQTFAVGASGAIFGLFGVWLIATYRIRHTPAGSAMFRQLAVLLAINAALPLAIPNIAWEAHAGGLAAGALIGWLWGTFASGRPNAVKIRTAIAAAVFVVAMVVVFLA